MKNLWSKTVKPENAYLTVIDEEQFPGWTWYVLKAYQMREKEKTNKYARWFCKVVSPYTGASGDLGDTYISEIPLTFEDKQILRKREESEALA